MMIERNSQESPSPRLDHILRALDFEINRIVAEQTQPGWTVWALLGGLATIFWLLSRELEAGSFRTTNVVPLFLVVVLLFDVLSGLNELLSERIPGRNPRGRFRLSLYYIGEHRVDTFFWAVLSGVLILIAHQAATEVWWPQVYIVYFIYGIAGLIGVGGLILSFLQIPLPVISRSSPTSIRSRLVSMCLVASLAWSMIGYFHAVSSSPDGLNPSDLRVSFLLVAGFYLLWLLARRTKEPPMLSSLVQVRRDLAFGRIDADTAIRQADIILAGMRVADLLQEHVREWVDFLDRMDKEYMEVSRKLEEVEASLPNEVGELMGEHGERVESVLVSCKQHFETASAFWKDYKERFPRLMRRFKFYAAFTEEPKAAAREVWSKIQEASEDTFRKSEEARKKFLLLKERIRASSPTANVGPNSG